MREATLARASTRFAYLTRSGEARDSQRARRRLRRIQRRV